MRIRTLLFIVLCPILLLSCQQRRLDSELQQLLNEHSITALDPGPEPAAELVTLGEALFFDKLLSGNRDISCATCHHPSLNGTDNIALSIGTKGHGLGIERELGYDRSLIPRNAPEIFNRGSPEWTSMFWDSRVTIDEYGAFATPAGTALPYGLDSILAAQAMFPVTSRDEMRGAIGDSDAWTIANEVALLGDPHLPQIWDALMTRVLAVPEYQQLFAAAYPNLGLDQLGFQHAANAIAAYEAKTFTLLDSPWDSYLAGEQDSLSPDAKAGAILFYGEAGCAGCHSGNLLTDQQHHNIGVPQLGPGKEASAPLDAGRVLVSSDPVDSFAFRTPPLRNSAVTAPYMHNGAYATLEAALNHHLDPVNSLMNYNPREHLPPLVRGTVQNDRATNDQVLATLDPMLATAPSLSSLQQAQLLAFLHSMTSPSIAELQATVPETVPSGLPVVENKFEVEPIYAGTIAVPADYATIQEAVDAASAGALITVAAGSYSENVTIDKPLALIAEQGVTLSGLGTLLTVAGTEHVRISGFTMRDANTAIHVRASRNVTISGNDISAMADDGIVVAYSTAIVRNNIIRDIASGVGVLVRNGIDSTITLVSDNYIARVGAEGIMAQRADVVVHQNEVIASGNCGVGVYDMANAVVSNNTLTQNHLAGVHVRDLSSADISQNSISEVIADAKGEMSNLRVEFLSQVDVGVNSYQPSICPVTSLNGEVKGGGLESSDASCYTVADS